jgi:NAD(P)-dependent dehydrogenase (short-subunit alcohol dehydrogenase family)
MSLKGKRVLVTGGSLGFGLTVARRFVQEGADVAICARTPEPLEAARLALCAVSGGTSRVLAEQVDIGDRTQVEGAVGRVIGAWGGIDVLVANAGIHGSIGPVDQVDWEAWEAAIRVNLFGSVHCCRAVLPGMKERKSGAIIVVSGGGATNPMPRMSAYAASKAGLVRFVECLARDVAEFGITVNAVAPGAMKTRLLDEVIDAGSERVGPAYYDQIRRIRQQGGTPLERGAELCVYLAGQGATGVTGRLISAVWDPWEQLDRLASDLASSDIYTLRRIVPKDRGLVWE